MEISTSRIYAAGLFSATFIGKLSPTLDYIGHFPYAHFGHLRLDRQKTALR